MLNASDSVLVFVFAFMFQGVPVKPQYENGVLEKPKDISRSSGRDLTSAVARWLGSV